MRSDGWRTLSIADLIADGSLAIGDGYRAKNEELAKYGLPFARVANINGGFRFDQADRFPVESLHRVGDKVSQPGDVAFTSKGTVGRFAFVRDDTVQFVYSPQLCYWRSLNWKAIQPRFLLYWMQGREFLSQVQGVKGQTDMADFVSLSDQRRMSITLPPLPEQRAIAHILGSLDDKIELNRQMNQTLEAMARALFKSWFVDFDPVRAKLALSGGEGANGDPYPLDAETLALFPDRFVDSELGEVPEGWEVRRNGEVFELAYGKALKEQDRKTGGVPVFGSNGQVGWNDTKLVSGPGIIVGRKGNPGTVTWSPTDFFPIDTTFFVVPNDSIRSQIYLFHALGAQNLPSLAADSAVPGVNRHLVYMNPILVPPTGILEQFDRLVEPISARVYANDQESRTLADLRDSLLPKLISGELRVPEIAETMEPLTP